jgi:hypothetical protein
MSAFKKLNRQDVYVTDYTAKKQWYASGSTISDYGLEVLRGFSGSTPGYPYPSDLRNNRHQKLTFDSIYHNYYTGSSTLGVFSGSYDLSLQTTLTLTGSRSSSKEVGVISIPRSAYGTYMEPGTVVLKAFYENGEGAATNDDRYWIGDGDYARADNFADQYVESLEHWYGTKPIDLDDYISSEGDYVIETGSQYLVRDENILFERHEVVDDKEGRLVLSGSTLPYTKNQRVVGDVIYNQGQIIITDNVAARYYSTYARPIVHWKSNLPIYTYNVHCTVKESELNYSFNPSSITGSDNTVRDNITGSEFRPYITTVGLYNEADELIAVAKTNRPIPKSENVDMTFVVKIDI